MVSTGMHWNFCSRMKRMDGTEAQAITTQQRMWNFSLGKMRW